MIKKVIKIKGVGRFSNYTASGVGDTQLRQTNIIYAENGKGKTTLVAILKSLGLDDPDPILRRKTFGFSGSQEVEILSDHNHVFQNNKWNNVEKPILETFDAFFVSENVYSDSGVSPDNKKKLHKFVVGAEGVKLSKEINDLKIEIDNKNRELREVTIQLDIHRRSCMIPKFISLKPVADVDVKIQNKKREINTANSIEQIKKKESLKEISAISLPADGDKIKDVLKKVISSVSKTALTQLEAHKTHLKGYFEKTDVDGWIEEGYNAVKKDGYGNNCPFCSQGLSNSEIFKAYEQYFNEAYNDLRQSVASYQKAFDDRNIALEINSRQLVISNNATLMEFWKDHIKVTIMSADLSQAQERLLRAWESVKKSLSEKISNLLDKVDSQSVDGLGSELNDINAIIESYNKNVSNVNKEISLIQTGTPVSLINLQSDLELLEITKKRYEPSVIALCDRYTQISADLQRLKSLNEQKQAALSKYSDKIFEDYGKKINEYLKTFNVNFEIGRIEGGFKGSSKEPFAEYVIRMAGVDIKFEDDGSSYTTKHTLSEGDKSSLALAFFLARLDLDQDIKNKILVLDDPLSSLDTIRRMRTVEYIGHFSKKVKQVIVLSHNDNFVYKLYTSENFTNPKTLKIQDKGEIVPWDIEEAIHHEYFGTLAKIETFIENGNGLEKTQAKRLIRLALENDLKFRFHLFLKRPIQTKDGRVLDGITVETGLGGIIERLEHVQCPFRDRDKDSVIRELNNLNQFSRSEHHGKAEQPFQAETDDVAEIQGYLKSTLDLIENRL